MTAHRDLILRRGVLLGMLGLAVASCGEDSDKPYLEFAGGGFIFNYRTANHYYGLVVRQKRPIPEGARFKVVFELPGGRSETVEEPALAGRLQYKFQTGDIEGIEANHPYTATVLLLDGKGAEIGRLEKSFKTEVDQAKLPSKPLVTGPGYEPSPQ